MSNLERVGVLAHPARPQTAPIAERIALMLRERDVDTWVYTHWVETDVRAQVEQADMVIAIGGDGAMLRASRVCAPFGVPVLGLNMGHLGFLTELDGPDTWEQHIDSVLAGRYWIEQRMMLNVEVWHEGEAVAAGHALNDAVISRGHAMRTVRLDVYIDDGWTTTYNADALVIATATGSTAYALACGGPILPPELRNLLIVPVAPHLSLDRPIVLPEGASVDVVVTPDTHTETLIALDGEMLADLQPYDRVCISASDQISRFMRIREHDYFYRSLLDRLEPRILRTSPGNSDQMTGD